MGRLLRELTDLRDYIVVPGLVVLLPHRWWYRLARGLAFRFRLFGEAAEQALAQARNYVKIEDERHWLADFRATMLMDHADAYLLRLRGPKALARRFCRTGVSWPDLGPFMVLGFHHGTGLFVMVDMAEAGHPPVSLHRHAGGGHVPGRTLFSWYVNLRWKAQAPYTTYQTARSRGGFKEMQQCIDQGRALGALGDVPPDANSGGQPVMLFDGPVRLRSGFVRLSIKRGVPMYYFEIRIDRATGLRVLDIQPAYNQDNAEALTQETAHRLEAMARRDSAAWMHWAAMEQFQVAAG
ncbi:MAG: hypothetical protein DHS20C11_24160 [Lysobacteraceae bacterium]|nr:MAG: hypothetical protein DHS20C11_24160 [Xanthomonadaceae bacterium]